jgi:signal transduction histidine kinase/PAS domain-containing protein
MARGGRGVVIAFTGAIFLIGAVLFAGLWWRGRAALCRATLACDAAERRHAGLASLLSAAPVAAFCWPRDAAGPITYGRLPGCGADLPYDAFVARLDNDDATRLATAVEALRRRGTPFNAALVTPDGTAYEIEGSEGPGGECILWVADASGLRQAGAARAAAAADAGALREMLDALPLPVWRRDPTLQIADCNVAFAAALDLSREAALANSSELAPDSGADGPPAIARAAAGAAQRVERHIVIAGSRRLLELVEAPARRGGTIGFALDRTDRESVESELARHVNAHGQVLESINAAVAIYGADKRLSFFNSAFAQLWGIEEDWLAGEPSLDELLERLRELRRVPEYADFRAFKRQQLEMFTSLIEPQSELMHLPDDRTLSLSISPHPLGGLIFVYEDVTDRLALERSYNTLIEVQRETLDNLFEGIAVFGSDGRLKLYNPAYGKIWGLSEADLAGEPHVGEIVEKARGLYDDGGDWPATRDRIIAGITAQTHWTGQLDRPDGSVLQMATVPLPDGNLLQTCLDVSDTARVERALRERNEALETADRLKSEFIANVSYELRTPLNAIIGFAEILANQYFGPLSERQLDYSRGILEGSLRLMTLINDILDLATIEAGYMVLETGPVDVRDMLDAVATLTRERARAQDLALTLACQADIGMITADERRLKQALFNLVSNAIKFTPPGGAVRLEARSDDDRGSELVLAVADTGVGIPPADQERIFEKFERGNPHARESGAGLGLSLVKSLIELHGGTVAIESTPGRGTTILCRLPAALRRPQAALADATPPAK